MITTIIQGILLGLFGLFTTYLALLSCLALIEKKRKIPPANKQRRFAIVVPAYNEAGSIGRTVNKLLEIDYPAQLFDVIVVADNCTDQTARIAAKAGAKVRVRNNADYRGKGYALRWCFDQLLAKKDFFGYDSVVVIDADSTVYSNMLHVFNNYREQGAEVIQGYLTIPAKPEVWTSEIIRIGLTLYNFVRPLGRRALGLSSGLRGNGMCFSLTTLRDIPWNAYSQTEDLEYGINLLLNDREVVFASETIGHNEIPEDSGTAESQRERWEIGRLPVLKKYSGKLFIAALKKRSFKIVDALIDLIMPPLVTMLLFILVMAGLSLVLWWMNAIPIIYMWLWISLFCISMVHALAGFAAADADKTMYKSLLYVPRYALWKLYLYVKVFQKGRSKEWVRTAREQL